MDYQFLTVGTFISAICAFLEPPEKATCMHLPAPAGLPGGYPVVVQDAAVRLDLPASWQKDEAVEVNRASHRWDGIESIEVDGTVVFADKTVGILREFLRYDWPRMRFEEVEAAASELRRCFDTYVKQTD